MPKKLKRTSKARLRAEFNTGDYYSVIVERLQGEALGRQVGDELKPWTVSALSQALNELGLRRKAPVKKTKPGRLGFLQSLLANEAIAPEERLALARTLLAHYGGEIAEGLSLGEG